MNLKDLEIIEDYHIYGGFLCVKLISGDHLRINFNSIQAIKKQFDIPVVGSSNKVDYKKGFELAQNYIEESPCDPDITMSQLAAYSAWNHFKNLTIPAVVGQSEQLSYTKTNKIGQCLTCGDTDCCDDFCNG